MIGDVHRCFTSFAFIPFALYCSIRFYFFFYRIACRRKSLLLHWRIIVGTYFSHIHFQITWHNPITSGYSHLKINTMRFPLIIILAIREIELNELAEQSSLKQTAAHEECCIIIKRIEW